MGLQTFLGEIANRGGFGLAFVILTDPLELSGRIRLDSGGQQQLVGLGKGGNIHVYNFKRGFFLVFKDADFTVVSAHQVAVLLAGHGWQITAFLT